jgi:hypothetical protein
VELDRPLRPTVPAQTKGKSPRIVQMIDAAPTGGLPWNSIVHYGQQRIMDVQIRANRSRARALFWNYPPHALLPQGPRLCLGGSTEQEPPTSTSPILLLLGSLVEPSQRMLQLPATIEMTRIWRTVRVTTVSSATNPRRSLGRRLMGCQHGCTYYDIYTPCVPLRFP